MSPQPPDRPTHNTDVTIDIRARKTQRDSIDLAEAVLRDRCFFSLDDEKFNEFLEALDTPPWASEKLRKLLTTEAPWD